MLVLDVETEERDTKHAVSFFDRAQRAFQQELAHAAAAAAAAAAINPALATASAPASNTTDNPNTLDLYPRYKTLFQILCRNDQSLRLGSYESPFDPGLTLVLQKLESELNHQALGMM